MDKVDICHLANYNIIMDNDKSMDNDNRKNLGRIIRQQRVTIPLTLQQLAALSEVSASHLGRIEKGKRFPSASILRKIAQPLAFDEDELFTLAGYFSPRPTIIAEKELGYSGGRLDPYVAKVLAEEPIEVQRAVIGILSVLKSMARGVAGSKEG